MENIGIETEQIEYKKTTGELKEAITSMVAIPKCDEAGCKVEFRTEKDDFVVVFFRNLREKWSKEKNIENPKHQKDVLDDVLKDVLENQIIKLLSEDNKMNQKQIAAKTGRSIASVQRAMKKLSEQGKIIREGGKRFGHWKIK